MENSQKIEKIPIFVTELTDTKVSFIAIYDIDKDGRVSLEKRYSSVVTEAAFSIHRIIGDVCSIGDYGYIISKIKPGRWDIEVKKMEDLMYYKKIFEDYLSDNLQDSYSDHIRDFKLTRLIEEDEK